VGSLGILVIVLIWKAVPSLRTHIVAGNFRPGPLQSIQNAVSLPAQQLALLFTILLVIGQFTIIPFLTPYMINNVGFTQDQILYIYLVGGACTAFTSPLIGVLVDKFGRKTLFYIAAVLSIFPTLIITHLSPAPIWQVLIVVAFFFVLVGGRMIPANTMLTTVVKPENRGAFLSLNSSVMSLGSGIASMIGGSIVVQSAKGAPLENYGWVGILAVIATLIAIFIARRL
jgi:predicted MFS family arabinose efflux permease